MNYFPGVEELGWIILPAITTLLGGLFILVFSSARNRTIDVMLGFTGGVMLAATSFSLLVPALEVGNNLNVFLGFIAGGLFIFIFDLVIPHAHKKFRDLGQNALTEVKKEQQSILLLGALMIHNIPEGAAVGLAFAAGGPEIGIPLALAISIQNIPEGFAAAVPLIAARKSKKLAIGMSALSGAVEPVAAIVAFAAFSLVSGALAFGLAFAAAAMLYVVVDELIPTSHGRGNERPASIALLIGFTLMLILDTSLG